MRTEDRCFGFACRQEGLKGRRRKHVFFEVRGYGVSGPARPQCLIEVPIYNIYTRTSSRRAPSRCLARAVRFAVKLSRVSARPAGRYLSCGRRRGDGDGAAVPEETRGRATQRGDASARSLAQSA